MRRRDRSIIGSDRVLKDQFGRNIDYIRVSVTDRCNFRCRYCMPEEGVASVCHEEILTYEEILRLLRIAVRLGIKKVKVTGGEPLVRKGVCSFIGEIRKMPGIESVTLTTNGALLRQYLPELKAAGVSGINISLDTLKKEKFSLITRRDCFAQVWEGIQEAVKTEIPVKINCVPMRGVNEEELTDIAALAKRDPVTVRFIEMMPVGEGAEFSAVPQEEIKDMLEQAYGDMKKTQELLGNGPAEYYELPGFRGKVGFISAISHTFCSTCNRVRLTADGILKPCLSYESHVDLKSVIRQGAGDSELEQLMQGSIYAKPECHGFGERKKEGVQEKRRMVDIGG